MVDHHAAQISVTASARDPLADARTNALGTLNVLEACRRNGVRKMIFISSGGAIYGDADIERIPETWPPAPLSPYAIHKLTGEHYLRFYRAQYGLHSTALRYANVYGPGQNPDGEAGVVAIFCRKLLHGETPALNAYPDDPAGMARDYVFVEDVAAANVLALETGDGDVFNIGTGGQDPPGVLDRLEACSGRTRASRGPPPARATCAQLPGQPSSAPGAAAGGRLRSGGGSRNHRLLQAHP